MLTLILIGAAAIVLVIALLGFWGHLKKGKFTYAKGC